MKLVCVKPGKRMDGILFNPQREYDHRVNIGTYTCPHCSQKIRFTTRNFDDAFQMPKTVLKKEHAEAFDRFRPIRKKDWERFLDFYCPGCHNPSRIIFQERGEEGMKGYSFEIVSIVEVSG